MAVGQEENHEFEGRQVRLVEVEVPRHGYERSRWALHVDGEQRGWIVHPNGVNRDAQLWNVLGKPARHAYEDGKTFLYSSFAYQKEGAEKRRFLAGRMLEYMSKGLAPTLREVEAAAAAKAAREEADKAAYAASRAAGVASTVEQHEAVVALRDRLAGAGLLTNHETEVFDRALRNLFSGYQYEAVQEIKRRAASREAGVPEDEPDASATPSP